MLASLLESECTISAVDARIAQLHVKVPEKAGINASKRRHKRVKRRLHLDQAAIVSVQEDARAELSPASGYLMHVQNTRPGPHRDVAGRSYGTASWNQRAYSTSPYSWCKSPVSMSSTVPNQFGSRRRVESPEPKKAATLRDQQSLRLPAVAARPVEAPKHSVRSTSTKGGAHELELPRLDLQPVVIADTIDGGSPRTVDHPSVTRSSRFLPEASPRRSHRHESEDPQLAVRRMLSTIDSKREVLEVCRHTVMALSGRTSRRGTDVTKMFVTTIKQLSASSLPKASADERHASMIGLLESEMKRRLEFLEESKSKNSSPSKTGRMQPPKQRRQEDNVMKDSQSRALPKPTFHRPLSHRLQSGAPSDSGEVSKAEVDSELSSGLKTIFQGRSQQMDLSVIDLVQGSSSYEDTAQPTLDSPTQPNPSLLETLPPLPSDKNPTAAKVEPTTSQTPSQPSRLSIEAVASTPVDKKPTPAKKDAKTSKSHDIPSRREMKEVFDRFVDDGSVHHDDMIKALPLMSFPPQQEWLDQAFSNITKYTTIPFDGFMEFVAEFSRIQRAAYVEAFNRCDEDNSGSVEVPELAKLLEQFGIQPMKHVLAEVIKEVDEDGSGFLDMSEFHSVMDLILGREGFSTKDVDTILDCFNKFDRDSSGSIERNELCIILSYLGVGSSLDAASKLIEAIDEDGDESMSEREFLLCMRKLRDIEMHKIRTIMVESDTDGSGTINGNELKRLMDSLGYFPSVKAIADAAAQLEIDPWTKELDLSDLWQLLQVFRRQEGFTSDEYQDCEQIFNQFAKKQSISTDDLDQALRCMGQVMKYGVMRTRTYMVDIDFSGQLDFDEFAKLVRMGRDVETHTIIDAFHEADEDMNGSLTIAQAEEILRKTHITLSGGLPPLFQAEDLYPSRKGTAQVVELQEVMTLLDRFRSQRCMFCREHSGYSYHEVDSLRNAFSGFDKDHSGELENHEMVDLLENMFPEMTTNMGFRNTIVKTLKEIDENKNGSLDFHEFLLLMRRGHDMNAQAKLEKEKLVLASLPFSQAEVHEFRQFFLASNLSHNEELSFEDFKGMIASICPMGERNSASLDDLFKRVVQGGRAYVDFPDFMSLLHILMRTNFGGINDVLETNFGCNAENTEVQGTVIGW